MDVPDDTGLDKIERCMCACKAIAPIGKGVFLEASLTYGCKAMQIGSMDKVYEELCLFRDDRPQHFNARNSAVACNLAVGTEFVLFY